MVHRGERGSCTRRSPPIPAERLEIERPLLGELPSLRARIGKVALRKVDRLSCVRFGSARYSVPTVHIGRTGRAPGGRRRGDGRVLGRDHRRTTTRRPW